LFSLKHNDINNGHNSNLNIDNNSDETSNHQNSTLNSNPNPNPTSIPIEKIPSNSIEFESVNSKPTHKSDIEAILDNLQTKTQKKAEELELEHSEEDLFEFQKIRRERERQKRISKEEKDVNILEKFKKIGEKVTNSAAKLATDTSTQVKKLISEHKMDQEPPIISVNNVSFILFFFS